MSDLPFAYQFAAGAIAGVSEVSKPIQTTNAIVCAKYRLLMTLYLDSCHVLLPKSFSTRS
jgi:hypothetical protein